MKRFTIFIAVVLIFSFVLASGVMAQGGRIRASLKGATSQVLGVDTEITIVYSRPGVKGRTIWGDLVPYGLAPGNRYSDEKPYPWRGGANENSTIEFGADVIVEGKKLPAGKYGLHFVPSETTWIVIFNKVNDSWGSYKYNEAEDALRVTVTPVTAAHQEWLRYGFGDLAEKSATVCLQWEKLKVPFKVELAE